ncbi:MAG TPA: hypothetical protein PKA37_14865 [Planctomycetota bacterium]|jgi:hypothetical protein|nr:hypothetical protein [Planctomycetota bacterium]
MTQGSFYLDGIAVTFVDEADAPLAILRSQALHAQGIRTWNMPSPSSTPEAPRVAIIVAVDEAEAAHAILEQLAIEAPNEDPEVGSADLCPACETELPDAPERCPECGLRLG